MQTTETVIVGAGQAGLALSHWLVQAGRPHVVIERGLIGQSWRDRWPSLRLLTPNSANRLPGAPELDDPDGFLTRDEMIDHLARYARHRSLPVLERTPVEQAQRAADGGFVIETAGATWRATNVVVASGHANAPALPRVAGSVPAGVTSVHSSAYAGPQSLPDGDVLVVGAGATGQQLAAELARAGRSVTLAVGRHQRLPRRYRGRDVFDWMQLLGDLDRTIDEIPDPQQARSAPSFALSGRAGGEDLDLSVLLALGVELRGRLVAISGRRAEFDASLPTTAAAADAAMRGFLRRVDERVARTGAATVAAAPIADLVVDAGPRHQRLPAVVLWATGYRSVQPWLAVQIPRRGGLIEQRRGVTPVPGLHVLGIRFQHTRRSHFIGGVGDDALALARHIVARSCAPGAAA
jgi:putative flavoprotein involved in K+ transport